MSSRPCHSSKSENAAEVEVKAVEPNAADAPAEAASPALSSSTESLAAPPPKPRCVLEEPGPLVVLGGGGLGSR